MNISRTLIKNRAQYYIGSEIKNELLYPKENRFSRPITIIFQYLIDDDTELTDHNYRTNDSYHSYLTRELPFYHTKLYTIFENIESDSNNLNIY